MTVFAGWLLTAMFGFTFSSVAFFLIAPRAQTTIRSVMGVLTGLAAVFLFWVLIIMGANALIETVAMTLGFGG